MPTRASRLVVLASGTGSTLQALLGDAELGPQIVAVGSDIPDCEALSRARAAGVATFAVPLRRYDNRDAWDTALGDAVAEHRPDLVVLAGFMRLLGPSVVRRFPIINTHPALLPMFPGAHAIRDALKAGAEVTGVTIHWVDEGVDTGPVIAQRSVPVEPDDDEQTLRARIQAVEKPLYVHVIRKLLTEQT